MSFIKVENIFKTFGDTQVLNGISFEIEEGQQVALQGMSGSGKSTLLYILGGLDTASSGKIEVDNKKIENLSDEELAVFRNKSVGFVFQFHFLLPSMNCIDNMLLPAKIGGFKIKLVKARILELAKRLGVDHCLKKYPFEISGGEQQRINIIRAISLKPKILLCDEPTGNLDSKNSQKVVDLLKEISAEHNTTLIVVTHGTAVASQFSRKITIEDGRIIG
jgi:ABC-type lipoprotein export system ATPase subunit